MGDDADTTGAIYGQLTGAFYGAEGIPADWKAVPVMRELIIELADRLYNFANEAARPGRGSLGNLIRNRSVPAPEGALDLNYSRLDLELY